MRHYKLLLALAFTGAFAFGSLTIINARAAQNVGTVSGTVRDPNGAVVVGAPVTVRSEATGETRNATTSGQGAFKVEGLAPGSYVVSVARDGFKPAERKVTVEPSKTATLEIKLEVAETRAEVSVGAKGKVAPNAEPNYRALRDGTFTESYGVSNLTLKRDVGTLTLRSGKVSFLAPVLGRTVVAVFVGDGEFTLTPAIGIERGYLNSITGKETITEPFNRAVLCFTDETYQEIKKQGQAGGSEQRAADTLNDFHKRLRSRTDRPRSFLEYLLKYEDIENIEAMLLADLYNQRRPGFFSAWIFGQKRDDLRFHVRPRGAMPQLPSPEEVALLNVDWQGREEGILYLGHYESEYKNATASSEEDKRSIDAEHYRIETALKGDKLTASAELTFKALVDGDRIIGFGLLPELRVTRVTVADNREIDFIQEKKKEDGSFYAVMPEPMVRGKQYKMTIDYEGNKVIEDRGGGNYAVGARTSWYPSVNAFTDRATFDLTFKVPKKYVLVGVGRMVKEWKDEDYAASQWVSEVPLAVAGFNYGSFKKKEIADEATKYQIEGYATSELPDYLRGAESIGGMSPTRLSEKVMVEAQNSMRIFSAWFGEAPYGRIAITQQPQFDFGQSWPTLVYLPISAFFDATQRWRLLGGINSGFSDFIQEVTPHEVAHQWWGHIVGWASYHDQWLSEGFADFSASLYLQVVEKDKYLHFWDQNRKTILEKNQFGRRPNDAGPLWMGFRLNSYKAPGAYNQIVYPKGGYVLHMLRWMMYDRKTGDQAFIAMMKDFVKTYSQQNASTEGFKAVVEKHMKPGMDLDGNKRMDWFFNQWVYGTEVPRYRFDYTLTPQSDGKVLLKGALTQSEVSPNFKMLVPVYLDFDGKPVRLGEVSVAGNMTTPEFQVMLPQKPKRVLINAYHDILAVESVSNGK
ncbi:MAG TPA: carboxypeptidase regulatory-like domain-containing protein [Blastocatellia bacterium]|nr:carboxypeptidase regulatory-like domain-containing protein [Blastocatellia bacterium]